MTLFPVILPVPESYYAFSGKEKSGSLSILARQALKLSAVNSGIVLGRIDKDSDNIPIPFDGNYWSLSHKPKYVAAVVSRDIVGIDIEEICPRSSAMFGRLAGEAEWALCKEKDWDSFFRYWTAKEAILKAVGAGVSGFKDCRVISIVDDNHVLLDYHSSFYQVEHFYCNQHMASILQNDNRVKWTIAEG